MKKVSRERIGKEFEGMVKTSRPDLAFKLILDFELWDIVFALPQNFSIYRQNQRKKQHLLFSLTEQ
jgi:tRNA nucleotidyltransferase/poly(A) polymerase